MWNLVSIKWYMRRTRCSIHSMSWVFIERIPQPAVAAEGRYLHLGALAHQE